jgi:MarR family transcriptional regulator, organic hydroperoxide resistance regulator
MSWQVWFGTVAPSRHTAIVVPRGYECATVRHETFVTKNLTDPEGAAREISRLYGRMWHRFSASKQPVGGSGLTARMLEVLRHLAAAGPLTVGEQAAHLGIGPATATELIDRLEAKGLVARLRDERDQRRVFVWLTDEGRRRLATVPDRSVRDPFVAAVAALDVRTRRQIVNGLSKLLEVADANVNKLEENVS